MTRELFKFISKHLAGASPLVPVDPNDLDQTNQRPDPILQIRPLVDTLNYFFTSVEILIRDIPSTKKW
jgi:hypothetical protein